MSKVVKMDYKTYEAALESQIGHEKSYPQTSIPYEPSCWNLDSWVFPMTGFIPRIPQIPDLKIKNRNVEITPSRGLYFPPLADSKKVILFFPGNAQVPVEDSENFNLINDTIEEVLERRNHGVFIVNYQSNLKKGPPPTVATLFQDAKESVKFLVEDKKIPCAQIVGFGYSIGSFMVMAAGAFCLNYYKKPFDKIFVDGAADKLSSILTDSWYLARRTRHALNNTIYAEELAKAKVPVVQFLRLNDRVVPPEAQWEFAALNSHNPNFRVIAMNIDHSTPLKNREVILTSDLKQGHFVLEYGALHTRDWFSALCYGLSYGGIHEGFKRTEVFLRRFHKTAQ